MHIRALDEESDKDALRACVIELQDYEREVDPRLPSGADMVDVYVPDMHRRCSEQSGTIFLAEIDDEIVGYVMVCNDVGSSNLGDGDIRFALVVDLVVRKKYRGRGFGRKLLQAAERHAAGSHAKSLRIEVLAKNRGAKNLYESEGFCDYEVHLEKQLVDSVAGT